MLLYGTGHGQREFESYQHASCPKDEGHDLRQGLRREEMRSVLLRTALLHEHEELAQDGDRLQVEREGPSHV